MKKDRAVSTDEDELRSQVRRFFGEAEQIDGWDLSQPMRWGHYIEGLRAFRVQGLLDELEELGFQDIEPGTDDDLNPTWLFLSLLWTRFGVYFAEEAGFTPESFVERVRFLQTLAKKHHAYYEDWSVGPCQ